jgi:hypothetical protein
VTSTYQFHPEYTSPHGPWVWVFASNESGTHRKGSAKVAGLNFRAVAGVVSGPTGNAYALTTFDHRHKLLPMARIETEVAEFLDYARANPSQNFFVTRIACAPGQLLDSTMAALFARASSNCSLPQAWMPHIMGQRALKTAADSTTKETP